MDDLEDQLRRAFEREDPPEGFADRVIERTRARRGDAAMDGGRGGGLGSGRRGLWLSLAAGREGKA